VFPAEPPDAESPEDELFASEDDEFALVVSPPDAELTWAWWNW
jgi:hypothetical protein